MTDPTLKPALVIVVLAVACAVPLGYSWFSCFSFRALTMSVWILSFSHIMPPSLLVPPMYWQLFSLV